jgi:DNA-binding transcriptional LysR family regulator
MKRPLSLNALQFFGVAARTGSFVNAATELFVTHGAVSRQVRLLEENLGVALFERRNRAVFLTHQGKQLQTTVTQMFAILDNSLEKICQPEQDSPLTVSCEPTILMKWLIPRLPDFYQSHPNIRLHLFAAGGEVAFARDGVDIALRRNDFYCDHTIHTEIVCDEWMAPVCSPTLLKRNKLNLANQCLLHSNSRPNAWANWSGTTGIPANAASEQSYEHFYLSLQAANVGLGVALSSALMAQDDLFSRRLVAPFGFVQDGSAYILLSPTPFKDDPRRVTFMHWIKEQMQLTLSAVKDIRQPSKSVTTKR